MIYQPQPNPFYIGQRVAHRALVNQLLTVTRYFSDDTVSVMDWDSDGEFSAYVAALTAQDTAGSVRR